MTHGFEKVKYSDSGIIPTRADDGSAGYDFYVPNNEMGNPDQISIVPGQMVKIKTNIKCKLLKDEVLLLFVRSSVGIKKNLTLANGTGVIDSTYYNNPDNDGNIIVCLYNYGQETQFLQSGDRIVQGVIVKYHTLDNDEVLFDSRIGGIGSSNR